MVTSGKLKLIYELILVTEVGCSDWCTARPTLYLDFRPRLGLAVQNLSSVWSHLLLLDSDFVHCAQAMLKELTTRIHLSCQMKRDMMYGEIKYQCGNW